MLSVPWVFPLSNLESWGIAHHSEELEVRILSTLRTVPFGGRFEQHLKWALAKEDRQSQNFVIRADGKIRS